MMGLNAMCKLNPDSAACNLLQREVCGQCPKWYLNQDHGRIIRSNSQNPAYKMMTNAECQRLKRELELSFVLPTDWPNSLIFIVLVLFILLCMGVTVWLLARAFIFERQSESPRSIKSDDTAQRKEGGKASVEHIVQQLRDKCNASPDKTSICSNPKESLFVPQNFWDKFPLIGNQRTDEQNTDSEASETSEESSESGESRESTESSCIEEANEHEEEVKASTTSSDTTCTTEEQSQQTTDEEDPVRDNYEQIPQQSNNSLADMPSAYYAHPPIGQTNNPSRGKIRWANWLRRGNATDFQVCKENIDSLECQKWLRQVYAQCTRLLSEKELEFWNDWWLDKPSPMLLTYQIPHLMTSEDCQKLRENIAQELNASSLSPEMNPVGENVTEHVWQLVILIGLVTLATVIVGSMVWLLNRTLRSFELERTQQFTGYRRTPRSLFSSIRPCSPLKRDGLYRFQNIVVPSDCGR